MGQRSSRSAGVARAFIDALDGHESAGDVVDSFGALGRQVGFGYFALGTMCVASSEWPAELWGTSAPEWMDHYIAHGYGKMDPVLRQLRLSLLPVRWSRSLGGKDKRGRKVLDEIAALGFRDGLACGALLAGGALAIAVLGTDDAGFSSDLQSALELAAQCCLIRLGRLRDVPPLGTAGVLSERERECLRWVADGKIDSEIADILTIAETTVHTHVKNAMRRLGARTRAQAVAKAIIAERIVL